MHLSRQFILRPVATSLLMVAILLSGLLAYRILPVASLPEVDYPTIQVTTLYPGASPEVVTSAITAPLERQFGQMPGLLQMSSSSAGGASVITLQFGLEVQLDIAEQEVQAAINAGSSLLPNDLPAPPIYSKVNPADTPIVTLAISSETLPLSKVQDLVDTRLAQKLSQLSGVGLVSLAGGQRPAMRVRVNSRALAALGLSLDDIRTAIGSANVNLPKGSFDGEALSSTIDTNDQLKSATEFNQLILAYRNGAPLRLADVAQVDEAAENVYLGAWAGIKIDSSAASKDASCTTTPGLNCAEEGSSVKPSIIVNIQRQPGANVIEVVDSIKKQLPQLSATLPAAVEVRWLTDRTVTIRASVEDVQKELIWAMVLVILVIFVFLRSVWATLIPSVAVPLSLIGTFGVMYLSGFSLNNLSLMALTIATGFVVDDAIVMIENISRYIEEGDAPLAAALKGSKQIGFTIISLTISLIAVLIPLLFMGDVVGRLFREFAITLAVSILISAVVSLTLTPMLCAYLLKQSPKASPHSDSKSTQLTTLVEERSVVQQVPTANWPNSKTARPSLFERVIEQYAKALQWVLRHQPLTLLIAVITLALTAALYLFIPKGFFPVQDTGVIQGISQAPQSISYTAMAQRQQTLVAAILRDKAVASVSSFIGVDGSNAAMNTGRVLINLKPLDERGASATEVIRRLHQDLKPLTEISLAMQPVQDLTIETRVSSKQYQFTLTATDMASLSMWVTRLRERLQQLPAFDGVESDLQDQGLRAYLVIDRDQAARLGITPAAIDNALYNAFGQRLISTIFTQSNQYRVVLEHLSSSGSGKSLNTAGLDNLNDVYIDTTNAAGVKVNIPLLAVAKLEQRLGPLTISHLGQFPAATLSFNLAQGKALGEAVDAVHRAAREINLPESISITFQGAAAAFQQSLAHTLWLILAAVITMYIVLGVLYESYIHPITILSTLPSAAMGALLALLWSGHDLSMVAIIGIILLIGIVKKNAIMMIDFALEAERIEGKSPTEAIYQAALLRFRPILMTTFAALLSAFPLMLGSGMGAELRQPLGITMVGGLLLSQILTLFTTPVIYLFFDRCNIRVATFLSAWRAKYG